MPTRTEARSLRQLEEALRAIRLAGRAGIGKRQLGQSLRLGLGRTLRIAEALDTAGLVDVPVGRWARIVARPPTGMPDDVQVGAALKMLLVVEAAAKRDRLAHIRGEQPV